MALKGPYKALKDRIRPRKALRGLLKLSKALCCLIPPFVLASIIPVAISPLSINFQNRIFWTPEMRGEAVPNLVQFWEPFLKGFGPQNVSQNCSKIRQMIYKFGIHFWIPFC